MMKPWITTEVYTNAEQKLLIQPTPGFDGIEIYFKEIEKDKQKYDSYAFYINPEELPIIIEKLNEMMNYINKK